MQTTTIDTNTFSTVHPVLMGYAQRAVRQPELARDLVQETWLAGARHLGSFDGRASFRTWMVGILKHKIVDSVRKASREQPIESLEDRGEDLDAFFADDGHFAEAPQQWGNPERSFEEKGFFDALERCLQSLPRNTARAFTMREVMGLETDEICKELRISTSNCWVMLYRARMSLRACLERTWFLAGSSKAG